MPTITTLDGTWDTGVENHADVLRRADSALLLGDGSNNGVRGGIVRHGDNSLAVSVNGSDQVTVQPGAFVIPAATGLGVYRGALSAATAPVGLATRNATNPRIDLVVIQATGAGPDNFTIKTIDGTPGASPSAPALPASSVELGRLNVPAVGGGAVTVTTSFRQYAAGLGGTLYVETAARLPGSGNLREQRAIALDTGNEHIWDAVSGTWKSRGAWTTWSPTLQDAVLGAGTSIGRYVVLGKTVHFDAKVNFGAGFSVNAFAGIYLPVGARSSQGPSNISVTAEDIGSVRYQLIGELSGTDRVLVYVPGTNGVYTNVGATSPFTWAAGDTLYFSGTYEAA